VVTLSFLAVLAQIWLGPFMWRIVLADLGTPVSIRNASMIFLIGQLGKYIPGSLWAFLVQMELAKSVGITRVRSFTSSVVTMGIVVISSLITAFFALPVILDGHTEYLWIFILLPFGLVLVHPRALTWFVSRGLRVLRRDPLTRPLTMRAISKALSLGLLSYFLFGLHLWLLADALGSTGLTGLMLCIGTMSLAMTTGVVAFFLPSGIGAREVVIVAMLATVLPSGAALTIALVSRLLFTAADLVAAGSGALLARVHRRPQAAQ
jgi:hypothetical protein